MIALATVMAVLFNSPLLKASGSFPLRLLRARGRRRGRLCRRLPADVQHRLRHHQQAARFRIGIAPVSWFANANAAMALVIIAVTWRWAGYNAIIILAGLAVDPRGCLRGCDARPRQQDHSSSFYITLPLLKPIILFCVVLSVIGTMQLFTEPFLITNRGGPGGGTETLGLLPLPAGLHIAEFRLRVGDRLHDSRDWRLRFRFSISGWGGNRNEVAGPSRSPS